MTCHRHQQHVVLHIEKIKRQREMYHKAQRRQQFFYSISRDSVAIRWERSITAGRGGPTSKNRRGRVCVERSRISQSFLVTGGIVGLLGLTGVLGVLFEV